MHLTRIALCLALALFAALALIAPAVAVAGPPYFNSSEPGCNGSDPNVLFCDDFETGVWYDKHCDATGHPTGTNPLPELASKGWCGTIYASINPAGAARCGGQGAAGTSCTATHGQLSGTTGMMADHALANFQGVNEIWVRYYTKPLAGYQFGAEKMLTFNDRLPGDAGIKFGNLSFNCAFGSLSSTGTLIMGFPSPEDKCEAPNVSNLSIVPGRWYYIEARMKLGDPGQANGLFELYANDCGTNGVCTGTPTLRTRRTNVRTNRASTSELIRVLWFESWSNPSSKGERYIDQIKASKVGPIGFSGSSGGGGTADSTAPSAPTAPAIK